MAEGFEAAKAWMLELAVQNRKSQIVLGLETTGHMADHSWNLPTLPWFFQYYLQKKSLALEAGGFFCVNSAKPFLFLVLKINSCYDKN